MEWSPWNPGPDGVFGRLWLHFRRSGRIDQKYFCRWEKRNGMEQKKYRKIGKYAGAEK